MAQQLKGALYQARPEGGSPEFFPAGLDRRLLPEWVRVDDGAFVEVEDAHIDVPDPASAPVVEAPAEAEQKPKRPTRRTSPKT